MTCFRRTAWRKADRRSIHYILHNMEAQKRICKFNHFIVLAININNCNMAFIKFIYKKKYLRNKLVL